MCGSGITRISTFRTTWSMCASSAVRSHPVPASRDASTDRASVTPGLSPRVLFWRLSPCLWRGPSSHKIVDEPVKLPSSWYAALSPRTPGARSRNRGRFQPRSTIPRLPSARTVRTQLRRSLQPMLPGHESPELRAQLDESHQADRGNPADDPTEDTADHSRTDYDTGEVISAPLGRDEHAQIRTCGA